MKKNNNHKAATSKANKNKSVKSQPKTSVTIARSQRTTNRAATVSGSPFSGDGRIRVTHREFLGDLTGSTAFNVSSYPLNPGIGGTFAWLQGLANLYESYEFVKFSVEYETACSSTTAGSVMVAIDYDASDSPPLTKQEMMAYHNAVRSAAWEECAFRADSKDLRKFGTQRYVRRAAVPPSTDIKTYDVGTIHVATSGMSGSAPVGEIYLTYTVDLMTPELNVPGELASLSAKISSDAPTLAGPFTTASKSGNLPVVVSSASTLTFTEVGQYLFEVALVGTVITNASPSVGGTVTSATILGATVTDVAATLGFFSYRLNVTAPNQTLTLSLAGVATTIVLVTARLATYEYSLA